MSMVTLIQEMKNYMIPEDTVVIVNSTNITETPSTFSGYNMVNGHGKKVLEKMHGKELSLKEFITHYPDWIEDYEWMMSKDRTKITHMDFGLTQIGEHMGFLVWIQLIIKKE